MKQQRQFRENNIFHNVYQEIYLEVEKFQFVCDDLQGIIAPTSCIHIF